MCACGVFAANNYAQKEKKHSKKDKKDKDKKDKGKHKKSKKDKSGKKRERSTVEVTPQDMEDYRRAKTALGDPMKGLL